MVFKIDVCITTYLRPKGLKMLLDGINFLRFKKMSTPDLRIVVVDNDKEGSAGKICQAFIDSSPSWELWYVVETRRGIPQARNRAIQEARPDADFIVFIDDDEEPSPQWLEELLLIQTQKKAAIVYGPVLKKFTEDPPEWIIKGGWFNRHRHEDGQKLDYCATGNLLISREVINALGILFNEEMALTGGEDTQFSIRAQRSGFEIYWAENAIVYEWQPKNRLNARWILMRTFRSGYTDYFVGRIDKPASLVRVSLALHGLARILLGGLLLFPFSAAAIIKGRYFLVRAIWIMFRGAGMLTAAVGIKYEEYKKVSNL